MIGAIAAVGSVGFTGWATYVSAQVAQDQLDQSKEENEKEERQQASRVTFWAESYYSKDSAQTIHLVNRTPDSVTSILVHVSSVAPDAGWYPLTGFAHGVPPCSDLVFKMSDQMASSNGLKSGVHFVPGITQVEGLVFTDASGVTWIRERDSLNKARESPQSAAKRKGSFIIREIEVKRVEPCDEYSSK
ncbi:hypothetical protein ACFW91_32125 [Streptomyces asoensis]|uniref:hypothetical protein n=1 Tax=Streptomyces asoensis TaxID=249586 RepID=UPI00367A6D58